MPKKPLNGDTWFGTIEARQALLHAIAIRETVESLPINRTHALHIPAALFAAATVFGVYRIFDAVLFEVPAISNWNQVVDLYDEKPNGRDIDSFLMGRQVPIAILRSP